ncbi:MAG TPA: hypothetical protein VM261_09475, partial [Kofleriaceae bacterium]|nr:hypothetical protein [Kofleriaceae bacterium]
MNRLTSAVFVGLLAMTVAACGGDKKDGTGGGTGTGTATGSAALPAITARPLGVESVKNMNYVYGAAAKEYEKALKAYKATPRDWAAVRAACEETIKKDAHHLDAHWVLGEAIAQSGDNAAAVEELSAALAGDWLRWGPSLEKDPELSALLATPHGKALVELSNKMKADFTAKVAAGPLVLARRSTFKMPGVGTNAGSTRGELYAYDVEGKRFLRVTDTGHELAGWVRSPSGDEILLTGFDKVEMPDPKKVKDAPPLLARSWVTTFSLKDLADTSALANVGKARIVNAGYGPGDQLVVTTAPASGRWGAGTVTTYVVDRGSGKLAKQPGVAIEGAHVEMTFDEVRVVGASATTMPAELSADLVAKLTPIQKDASGAPMLSLALLSPGKTRLAFATATDPCADTDDAAKPSIYVADAKTGAFKHVLTASSRFAGAWID